MASTSFRFAVLLQYCYALKLYLKLSLPPEFTVLEV